MNRQYPGVKDGNQKAAWKLNSVRIARMFKATEHMATYINRPTKFQRQNGAKP